MIARQQEYSPDNYMQGVHIVERIDWITTEDAAAIMKVAEETVRRLCREEKIHSRKWHRSWQVDRVAAETYIKTEGGRGNKYKTEKENDE